MPQAPARPRGAAPCRGGAPGRGPAPGRCGSTTPTPPAAGRPADGGAPVLRLAATMAPGQAAEVALAVAGRAARAGAAVIVLDLGQGSDLGASDRSELCAR